MFRANKCQGKEKKKQSKLKLSQALCDSANQTGHFYICHYLTWVHNIELNLKVSVHLLDSRFVIVIVATWMWVTNRHVRQGFLGFGKQREVDMT